MIARSPFRASRALCAHTCRFVFARVHAVPRAFPDLGGRRGETRRTRLGFSYDTRETTASFSFASSTDRRTSRCGGARLFVVSKKQTGVVAVFETTSRRPDEKPCRNGLSFIVGIKKMRPRPLQLSRAEIEGTDFAVAGVRSEDRTDERRTPVVRYLLGFFLFCVHAF